MPTKFQLCGDEEDFSLLAKRIESDYNDYIDQIQASKLRYWLVNNK